MASKISSQFFALIFAAILALVSAGLGPSADGNFTDKDKTAYIVTVGVACVIFIVAVILYCQLQHFMKVGKIEEQVERAARQKIAEKEAATKAHEIATQKEKARNDIAAQKAKQKTK